MSYPTFISLLALTSIATAAQEARSLDEVTAVGGVKTAPQAYVLEPVDHEVDPAISTDAHADAMNSDAQASPPIRAAQPDRDRLYFDVDAEGTVWVRGRTYKASFSESAATYIPFLGSDAPRNYPVSMRLDALTIAGSSIPFDSRTPAVRDGNTIEYARGGFRERYELTPDSIEQTFVFDELPRRGEIVVTIDVTSELQRASDAEGFRFENELGHVRYGRAFAFHDDSPKTAIESRMVGSSIELVAPASVVECASGRFVIDPVLSTYVVESALTDEFAADTAYDSTNSIWLTVSEEVFSASDHDIHAVRHQTSGFASGQDYVDFTGDDWRAPAVANNNLDDQFLVVATRGTPPNRLIWGRTVEATASLNMSAQFPIGIHDFFADARNPDVGGDPSTSAPSYYAVVWESDLDPGTDSAILARLVRTDATLVGTGTIEIDFSLGTLHRHPRISNSNGTGSSTDQDWNIVWEHEVSPTNRNILGARLHWNGTLTSSTFTVASSILDERNPSVTPIVNDTGGTRPWMVAYQVDTGTNGWDVRCRTFNGATSISTFDLSEQFPSVALDQITPSCDTDGQQFVVVYDERSSPTFFSTDLKLSTLYSLGGALGVNEGNVSVSPGIFTDLRPRVVTNASSGSSIDDALIVFDRDDGGPNDVYATAYDIPQGGPVTSYCSGDGTGSPCPCGNNGVAGNGCASSVNAAGAHLGSTGNADLSVDTLLITATGLPASAPVLFFQGTTQTNAGAGSVFGDGLRCASGTVIRLATKTASGGVASYPVGADLDVSVRGAVPAAGAVRYYQGWYRNSAAFCTISTFNLTNGLRVQWIP